jgi:hypothetical protein
MVAGNCMISNLEKNGAILPAKNYGLKYPDVLMTL